MKVFVKFLVVGLLVIIVGCSSSKLANNRLEEEKIHNRRFVCDSFYTFVGKR